MFGLGTTEVILLAVVGCIVSYLVFGRRSRRDGPLVPCPDCGHGVSRLASTCPHCGRPLQ